jgi:hypothetical protein
MNRRVVVISLGIFVGILLCAIDTSAQTKRVNVRFRTGTTGGSYSNTVSGYATVDFYLQARGGQNLKATLTSNNDFLYFVILRGSGNGEAVADDAREVTTWNGTLPANGTYVVRVFLVRAEARRNKKPVPFTLRLDIQ